MKSVPWLHDSFLEHALRHINFSWIRSFWCQKRCQFVIPRVDSIKNQPLFRWTWWLSVFHGLAGALRLKSFRSPKKHKKFPKVTILPKMNLGKANSYYATKHINPASQPKKSMENTHHGLQPNSPKQMGKTSRVCRSCTAKGKPKAEDLHPRDVLRGLDPGKDIQVDGSMARKESMG